MNKKGKYYLIGIVAVILLSVAVVSLITWNRKKDYVNHDDDEKLIQMSKDYVNHWEGTVSYTEDALVVKKADIGIIAVLLEFEKGGENNTYCVYFSVVEAGKDDYVLKGAQVAKAGSVVAEGQYVGEGVAVFIYGSGLSEETKNVYVEELAYEGKIEDNRFLDVIMSDSSPKPYEVTVE